MGRNEVRDVVVVGGGFAGVTAARDLRHRGFDVLLLEARDRLGGRTWTAEREGWTVELGGTWIHWSQPFVWAEVQRYGLEIEQTEGSVPERVVLMVDGDVRELGEEEMGEFLAGFDRFFEETERVWERPYDQSWSWRQIEEHDRLSLADRLEELGLSDLQRSAVGAVLETLTLCPLERSSYNEMMRVYALAGRTYPLLMDSVARFKLSAGTGALIRTMADDGGFDIELGSPVTAIRQHRDGVELDAAGSRVLQARRAIVAVPLNVQHRIDFTPPLSSVKRTASTEGHAGKGFKVFLEVEGDPGVFMGLSSGGRSPLGACFTFARGAQRSLVVGFGLDAALLERFGPGEWQEALAEFAAGVRVTRCFGHSWCADPLAHGTWCSYQPGQLSRFGDELARPEGHVHFASGDATEGWRGFIDGAIASGVHAATAVARSLRAGTESG